MKKIFILAILLLVFSSTTTISAYSTNNKLVSVESSFDDFKEEIQSKYDIELNNLPLITKSEVLNIMSIEDTKEKNVNEFIDFINEKKTSQIMLLDDSSIPDYIFDIPLNENEIILTLLFPEEAIIGYALSLEAKETTINQYPNNYSDGSKGNAFQHSYWNVLMTWGIGADFAEMFATAHEMYPNNPENHKSMDLHNNKEGRILADSITNLFLKSREYLINETMNLINIGKLKFIIKDYTYIHTIKLYDNYLETIYGKKDFIIATNRDYPHSSDLPEIIILDYRTRPGDPVFPDMEVTV